jgi:hypothetical protein
MVRLGPGRFSQIEREELDDEQIIGCPSCTTHEVIILQPNTGVGFAIVFGDVARCSKVSWKTNVAHDTFEYLGTRPLGTEVVSLMIVVAPVMWVPCVWLGLCLHPLGDAAGMSGVPIEHSSVMWVPCVWLGLHRHPLGDAAGMSGVPIEHSTGPSGLRSRSLPVKKPFPHPELLGRPSVPHLWGWGAE